MLWLGVVGLSWGSCLLLVLKLSNTLGTSTAGWFGASSLSLFFSSKVKPEANELPSETSRLFSDLIVLKLIDKL